MSTASASIDETPSPAAPRRSRLGYSIFDIEMHMAPKDRESVARHLPARYRERHREIFGAALFKVNLDQRGGGNREDADISDGRPPASNPALIRRQMLDPYEIEWAICTHNDYSLCVIPDAGYAAALASAYNDWMLQEFVPGDPAFLGSLTVATQDADLAVREIERLGSHPRVVEILIGTASQEPLGNRRYHKIYEAAQAYGLPVAAHTTVEGRGITGPPGSAGYPSRYLEYHTNLAASAISQVASLVCEGVFARFPGLKFVLLEGGVSWSLPLMWKLDAEWKRLRAEMPQVKELPSDYLRRQLFYTTQPIEEPLSPRDLLHTYEQIGGYSQIMFSSDYPHWDFDDPFKILPGSAAADLKRRILRENALDLYRHRMPNG